MPKLCAAFMVHDDTEFLGAAISSFALVKDIFVFVSKVPWGAQAGDWQAAQKIAENAGAKVVLGEWASEHEQREYVRAHLLELGFTHALIPDGDEIIEPNLLGALTKIAESELADRVYVEWDTYWKDSQHVVRPREGFTPCILLDLRVTNNVDLRDYRGGRSLLLNATYGFVHHLSYAGSNARIQRKVTTWSHKDELVPGWWELVWKGWDANPFLQNLHPTHPEAYRFVERIHPPAILEECGVPSPEFSSLEAPANWPSVSIVIPLHGGESDITKCLESLAAFPSLLHQVIVVDNASPDGAATLAAELVKRLPSGKVIALAENTGFAHACNVGFYEATGDVVLFLNSDTVVPRAGLIRLVESLMASGSIAAAGPLSNNVGHFQQTPVTYTSWDTIDLFAEDFARREAPDTETDMLVGFCLAARKSVILEVGPFDESFGIGTFEDNDLCYRMRRAGYRLIIAGRSFVHHTGSQTLTKVVPDPQALLRANLARFQQKWRGDLEFGFASHLSGLSPEPICFDPTKKPEAKLKQLRDLAQKAGISLCMIVKNEERVLADCLRSAQPFFQEIIVVDTGSSDRTVQIAKEHGAQVHEIAWPDSFALARNESLKHASGKWVFWLDADDTLPFASGEAIVSAAIHAPKQVAAFVVPVRFTDEGEHSGVQVDHVKLFRNVPGLEFEGRIHEQILPSLRRSIPGGEIARLGAVVLHSGYDSSEEGQARKRERDEKLLKLDLADRPNHPFVLFNLGMTAHYTGDHEGALEWLTKCLEHSGSEESHVRKTYAMMGGSYRRLGRIEEAIACLKTGLETVQSDPEIHFLLGQLYAERGEFDLARHHYRACLESDVSGVYTSYDRGLDGFKTMHNLGGIELSAGNYAEARRWFLEALKDAPEHLPSCFALFDAALTSGDRQTAEQMLEHVRSVEREGANWVAMRERLPR